MSLMAFDALDELLGDDDPLGSLDLAGEVSKFRNFGFAIHWLQARSKKPVGTDGRGSGWTDAPVASLDDLRRSYRDGYNVGVRLGEPSLTPAGYLHVLDIDIRIPDLADEAWERLREMLGDVIDTLPCVASGSGGESRHLYYFSDRPFSSRKLAVSEGKHRRQTIDPTTGEVKDVWSYDWEIELFGTGKQAAMPPSIHPDTGLPYRWERPFDFDMLNLGIAAEIASSAIEALGVAESSVYAFELEPPAEFKPGELQGVLDDVPLERIDDRDDWVKLGMSLHHQFGGSDEGFKLWMKVSSRSSKHLHKSSLTAERRRYRGFGKNRKRPVTMRSIIDWVTPIRETRRVQALHDALGEDDDTDAFALDDLMGGNDIGGFALTEDGVALAFAEQHRDKLRYCHTAGAWFEWAGTYWRRDETKLAFAWARKACRDMAREEPKNTAAKALSKAAAAAAVERFAQADRAFAVTGDVWDQDPWLLGTPGGVVDLRTGELRPAEPRDSITKLTTVTPALVANCPRWLAFLDEATAGDRELIRFLQLWAGYCLTGDTREHALLFVYGPGGNGKSVFLNVLTSIMGDYTRTAGADVFAAGKGDRHPQEIARLRGARLVCTSETEEGRAWAEVKIKALTGGDTVTARFMYQGDFEFRPQFKLTIVGNHAPVLRNVDEAARRRFNIVPFTHKPAKPDSDLEQKLKTEAAGILAWMIEGCLDWRANGLVRPAVVANATESYFEDQDVFGQWLQEACEVGSTYTATTGSLFNSYRAFAEGRGEAVYGKSRGFPDAMRFRGFRSIRDEMGMRGRGFAGLKLRDQFVGFEEFEE